MLAQLMTVSTSLPAPFDQIENAEELIAYTALGTVILLLAIFALNAFLSIKAIRTKKPANRIMLFLSCGIFMFLFVTNALATILIFTITNTFNGTGILLFSVWFVLVAIMISLTVAALRTKPLLDIQGKQPNESTTQEA